MITAEHTSTMNKKVPYLVDYGEKERDLLATSSVLASGNTLSEGEAITDETVGEPFVDTPA